MPEPTPDRAVSELSDEELVKAFELAVIGSTISFEAHISERDNTRAELLRRLSAATERPVDGVMIPLNVARGIVEWPPMFNEWERLARLQDAVFAAIRAASAGGDCG